MGAIPWGTGVKIRQLGVQDRSLVLCDFLSAAFPVFGFDFFSAKIQPFSAFLQLLIFSCTAKPASH